MEPAKTFETARWLRDTTLQLLDPQPASLALFGSFAKGNWTAESDLDLLVVSDTPRLPYDRTLWISPLLKAWRTRVANQDPKIPLSPLFLSKAGLENSIGLRLSLSDHAWILWDDGYLSAQLHEASDQIRKGLWWRKDLPDGGWLWVPKGVAA